MSNNFLESKEAAEARHLLNPLLERLIPTFTDYCLPLTPGAGLNSNDITEADIGKPVRIIIGASFQDGILVGKVMKNLLIEFIDGTQMPITAQKCIFI